MTDLTTLELKQQLSFAAQKRNRILFYETDLL